MAAAGEQTCKENLQNEGQDQNTQKGKSLVKNMQTLQGVEENIFKTYN